MYNSQIEVCLLLINSQIEVSFGRLTLPAGGLSVSGRVYTASLSLAAGQSISW